MDDKYKTCSFLQFWLNIDILAFPAMMWKRFTCMRESLINSWRNKADLTLFRAAEEKSQNSKLSLYTLVLKLSLTITI